MRKSNKRKFSWTKRLVRQVVQRILDAVLWPTPVTAHWEAGRQNLCQTWEWTFLAPWDKVVMKCPPQSHGQVCEQKGALPVEDWHLPSTSTAIISWPLNCWHSMTLKGVQGQEWRSRMRHSCSGKNWQNRPSDSQIFSRDFMSPNSCIFSYLEKHWHH